MSSTLRTLVIIPTYNERATLRDVTARILTAVPAADLLIIDDASPDGTGAVATSLSREDARVNVMHRPKKLGLGTAYLTGFSYALSKDYDIVVECDGDGSHQPEELPRMLSSITCGVDAVIGSRWIPNGNICGWARYRRWISRTGNRVARRALGSSLTDLTSGYRAITSHVLSALPLDRIVTQGYGFQVEVAWLIERAGFTVVEVPITFTERKEGKSKMSLAIVFEALIMLCRLRRNERASRRR